LGSSRKHKLKEKQSKEERKGDKAVYRLLPAAYIWRELSAPGGRLQFCRPQNREMPHAFIVPLIRGGETSLFCLFIICS